MLVSRFRCAVAIVLAFAGSILPYAGAAQAGTSGKLTGRVTDAKKQPMAGANVAIIGVQLGAASGDDGRFTILNIPAGTYVVKVSLLGYRTVATQSVVVSSDHTTTLDVALDEAAVEMKEVLVTAKRPVVDVTLTSNVATVSREEIAKLPVESLQDLVKLQAGVVDDHFRGGRSGEVQYQVDGVSVNNVYDNTSSVRLDRSLLEEVQVISGTFDAEYGQAMSGVVNAVLKRGTDKLTWTSEAFTGAYKYADNRGQPTEFHPGAIQNYQVTVSGPTHLPQTLFIANARRYTSDDYVDAIRLFRPTDRPDSNGQLHPSGDLRKSPLGFSREWSGLAKITNRSLPHIEIGYQAIFNVVDARRGDFAFRYDPDGMSKQATRSVVHGVDWTQTLSKTTYYKLNLRQNYFDYRDRAYHDLFDPRYDSGGNTQGADNQIGAITQGVSFTRFRQTTNTPILSGSLVRQASRAQTVKLGGEFQWPRLRFGNDGTLANQAGPGGTQVVYRYLDQPPNYPGVREYRPVIASAYAQDDVEWNDIRLRAGLRYEFFDARSSIPKDLANPANSIAGAPPSPLVDTKNKMTVMPRIGVSYPITNRSAVFFAYGHFTQMPTLNDVFSNADYSTLATLQAGIPHSVMGNPDVKPEKTVQYQLGYKQALTDAIGVDVNVFYKDIRDLLGVEFVSTYNDAEYPRLTNADFGNVIGFTVSLDQHAIGLLSTSLDYTWQRAEGNTSDPRETATRAEAGQDPRPRLVPLDWDQRHTLNLTATLARADVFTASAVVRVASGQPFTPSIGSTLGDASNSGRKPAGAVVDLRGEKDLRLGGARVNLFGRLFNAFDARFFNGSVFSTTGSPYYSLNPADLPQLLNPTRFFGPRRIEIGLTLAANPS